MGQPLSTRCNVAIAAAAPRQHCNLGAPSPDLRSSSGVFQFGAEDSWRADLQGYGGRIRTRPCSARQVRKPGLLHRRAAARIGQTARGPPPKPPLWRRSRQERGSAVDVAAPYKHGVPDNQARSASRTSMDDSSIHTMAVCRRRPGSPVRPPRSNREIFLRAAIDPTGKNKERAVCLGGKYDPTPSPRFSELPRATTPAT